MKINLRYVRTKDLQRAIDEQKRMIEFDEKDGTLTPKRKAMMQDEINQAYAELKRRGVQQ